MLMQKIEPKFLSNNSDLDKKEVEAKYMSLKPAIDN